MIVDCLSPEATLSAAQWDEAFWSIHELIESIDHTGLAAARCVTGVGPGTVYVIVFDTGVTNSHSVFLLK